MKKLIKKSAGFLYYNFYKKFQNNIGNRILLYHSIGTKLPHDSYGISISPKLFEEHLKFLKDNYEIIPINANYISNLCRFTISITLDDGYKDNLIALEIFEKYDISFILFVTSDFIGKKYYLDKNELKELTNSKLCTIGSHGKSHKKLSELSVKEQEIEIVESKQRLEDLTGERIKYFSYPHGSFNKTTLKILKKENFNLGFSSIIGVNTSKIPNYYLLKRTEIVANDNVDNLQKKIKGYFDYLKYKLLWQTK
jgi:peptidoglycan/xylan/chitin deacetylase (PgdA/CDA1 family)